MKIKNEQIEWIDNRLREDGMDYDPLREEMVDHLCFEIESLMADGMTFMEAFKKAYNPLEKRGPEDLNKETTNILSAVTMTRNFLVTARRLFVRNLSSGLIKVIGLAMGIAVFIMSLLFSDYEYSYDDFFPEAENIYRIIRTTQTGPVATTTFPLAAKLRGEYPDYQFTTFFKDRSKTVFRKNDQSFLEDQMIWADEHFLKIFPFEGFKGDPKSALKDPYSVVLTEQVAQKYFSKTPEVGDIIEFTWNDETRPLKITGIIPEWPENMHISFEILVSFSTAKTAFPGGITESWNMNYCYTYVKLPSGVNPETFENRFSDFYDKYIQDEKPYTSFLSFLQPVTKIHIQPEVRAGYTNVTNPNYPKIGWLIGVLIITITGINFVTLTITQFHERAKEVGIRKAIGANRGQVVYQLIFETCILVSFSFLMGLGIVFMTVPTLNQTMGVVVEMSQILDSWILYVIPVMIVSITLLTGLFPAIVFSRRNIITTLEIKGNRSAILLRRVLLSVQFLISTILLVSVFVIYDQVQYMREKPIGYNRDQVLYIPHARQIRYNPEVFKAQALSQSSIRNVSLSFYKPTDNIGNTIEVAIPGRTKELISAISIDEDFFQTFGISFKSGQDFNTEIEMDKQFILNESAVRKLGLEDPVGQSLTATFQTGNPNEPTEIRLGKVVGVVEDVHFESLHHPIKPLVFLNKPYWYYYINVRIDSENIRSSLDHLQETWQTIMPERPFEYTFLNDEFASLYENEQKLASGLSMMAILALLTTGMGLFAFVQMIAQQRTKEIGIRKVLGADVKSIFRVFSSDFALSMLIGCAISIPIGVIAMEIWLDNFSYRMPPSIMPYLLALLILVIISLITVSREFFKLISINPSKVLRYD